MKSEYFFREKLKKIEGAENCNFGGWITVRDREFIIEFLQTTNLKSPLLVEIGTFMGSTATIFLTILDDCKLVAIDNWSEGPFKPFKSLKEGFDYHMKYFIDQGRAEVITGDSKDVGKLWNRKINLLFIDGSHNYDVVLEDIRNFTPWLSEGGYVFLDDYGTHSDVTRAVNETLINSPTYKLIRRPKEGLPSPDDEKLILFQKIRE